MSLDTKSKGNTRMNQETACFYNRQGEAPEGPVKPAVFSPVVRTFSNLTHLEAAALMDSRLSRPAWPPWDPLTMSSSSWRLFSIWSWWPRTESVFDFQTCVRHSENTCNMFQSPTCMNMFIIFTLWKQLLILNQCLPALPLCEWAWVHVGACARMCAHVYLCACPYEIGSQHQTTSSFALHLICWGRVSSWTWSSGIWLDSLASKLQLSSLFFLNTEVTSN